MSAHVLLFFWQRIFLLQLLASGLVTAILGDSGPPLNSDPTSLSIKEEDSRTIGTARQLAKSGQAVARERRILERGDVWFPSSKMAPRTRRSRDQCSQTCTHEENVTCEVTRRSTMCIHKDESANDFPNRPRDLAIEQVKVGEKVHFNITWKAPYDYSYKAVRGYEMHVTRFDFNSHPLSVDCYFMNLSATNWTSVAHVHEVVYYVDCVWMWAAHFRMVHVKIFSYPKLAGNHQEKDTEAWVYPEEVRLKQPSMRWEPSIQAVPDLDNRSLVVTVKPLKPDIAYLKLCVSRASSIPCLGKVFLMESPSNTLRYRVEGLACNQSYYIYVKPFSSNNEELDVWLHKTDPVFFPCWPEEPVKPAVEGESGVGLGVVGALVGVILLLLVGLLLLCFLWRKGYLQKIWFLRSCFPHAGLSTKVVQLYVRESEPFSRLVKAHRDYLCKHVMLEWVDCEDMRYQQDVEQWLGQAGTFLVYLSPVLMNELLYAQGMGSRSEATLQNPFLTTMINHIQSLASCRGRKQKAASIIFISPECWSEDLGSELSKLVVYRNMPCHSISSPPAPLLRRLSDCHRCMFTACLSETQDSQDISNTIKTLQRTVQTNESQYREVYMNGHASMLGDGDCNGAVLQGKGMETPYGRQGHPHRTDSGFSSSAPDRHRGGSNSSSEHASQRVENGEEEGTERDPMIQGGGRNLSVSQVCIFVPPESVADDDDSMVIAEKIRQVNLNGEWSSRQSHDWETV
ncbi:uncharacterized protein LOC143284451 isoform X2 [Babylonia areolata]|uniref:uncharacterized protein LOC143284451 isoform X2 n=1 Tax=Babylonia areolata TaxID=304850 RepID=UPI003FD608F1